MSESIYKHGEDGVTWECVLSPLASGKEEDHVFLPSPHDIFALDEYPFFFFVFCFLLDGRGNLIHGLVVCKALFISEVGYLACSEKGDVRGGDTFRMGYGFTVMTSREKLMKCYVQCFLCPAPSVRCEM